MAKADMDRERIGGIKVELQSSAGTGIAIIGPQHGPSPEYVAEARRRIAELETKVQASVDEYARRVNFATPQTTSSTSHTIISRDFQIMPFLNR